MLRRKLHRSCLRPPASLVSLDVHRRPARANLEPLHRSCAPTIKTGGTLLTALKSTLAKPLVSADSKVLTPNLTPLFPTLTKTGGGPPPPATQLANKSVPKRNRSPRPLLPFPSLRILLKFPLPLCYTSLAFVALVSPFVLWRGRRHQLAPFFVSHPPYRGVWRISERRPVPPYKGFRKEKHQIAY